MADMNPELAFLNAQKDEYDPTVDYAQPAPADDDEGDDEEEYDPAAYPVAGASTPSDQSASMPESAANTPPPATDEALKPPAIQASAAAATPSKQPPRTKGGFVDESEDEDEVPVSKATGSALLNADGVSDAPQRSLTNTPSNTLAPSNVPVHSAQHLGHSGVSSSTSVPNNDAAPPSSSAVPNGGMPVPDITKTGIADALNTATARPSTAPITPAPSSLTKQRLPQDRIGIFEDRIADDPRGDIEAWLSLIEEHRRRHKFDDARAVYDRFFNTFPSFVGEHPWYLRHLLTAARPNNGSSISGWSQNWKS
jgi:cleavage stimulation factor subunit 3